MSEDPVERPRDPVEVERLDEQTRVADLAPSAAAHETPKLLLGGAASPCGHLLELSKAMQIVVRADDPLHARHTERADQLLLQIRVADEEPEAFHVRAGEAGAEAEAGPLQRPAEDRFLARIAETCEPRPIFPELLEERSDPMSPSETLDADSQGSEVDGAALGQRFHCHLVALAFDHHDRGHDGLLRRRWRLTSSR
jgi:hypothetical protein